MAQTERLKYIITQTGAKAANDSTNKLDKSMGSLTKTILGVAAVAAVAYKGMQFMFGSAELLRADIVEYNKLEAIIKATGVAAGTSADDMAALAQSIQDTTGVSNTLILKAEGMLATFKQIGEDTFPRATQALVDMSAVQGELTANTLALGKALNDPIAGVGALSRVGVQFTDQQKAQIKVMQEAGDVAGAQTIILEELEGQFKGAAEAAALNTTKMSAAFDDMRKGIAAGFEPLIQDIAGELTELFKTLTPIFTEASIEFSNAFREGLDISAPEDFEKLQETLNKFAKDFGKFSAFLVNNTDLIIGALTALAAYKGTKGLISVFKDLSLVTLAGAGSFKLFIEKLLWTGKSLGTTAGEGEIIIKTATKLNRVLSNLPWATIKLFSAALVGLFIPSSVDPKVEEWYANRGKKNAESYYEGYAEYLQSISGISLTGVSFADFMESGEIDSGKKKLDIIIDAYAEWKEKLEEANAQTLLLAKYQARYNSELPEGTLYNEWVAKIEVAAANTKLLAEYQERYDKALEDAMGYSNLSKITLDVDIPDIKPLDFSKSKASLLELITTFSKHTQQLEELRQAGIDTTSLLSDEWSKFTDNIKTEHGEESQTYKIMLDLKKDADSEYLEWRRNEYANDHEFQMQLLDSTFAGYDTFVNSLTDMEMTGKERREAIWESMKSSFVSTLGDMLKMVIKNAVISALIGKAAQVEAITSATATGIAVASAWSTAAAFTSLATLGTNSVPAMAGMTTTVALGKLLAAKAFAKGADYTTTGPEMILVGDNPGGRERVSVTPLSSPNINGPQGGSSGIRLITTTKFVTVDGDLLASQIDDEIFYDKSRRGERLSGAEY